jgi:hypothetical protein
VHFSRSEGPKGDSHKTHTSKTASHGTVCEKTFWCIHNRFDSSRRTDRRRCTRARRTPSTVLLSTSPFQNADDFTAPARCAASRSPHAKWEEPAGFPSSRTP